MLTVQVNPIFPALCPPHFDGFCSKTKKNQVTSEPSKQEYSYMRYPKLSEINLPVQSVQYSRLRRKRRCCFHTGSARSARLSGHGQYTSVGREAGIFLALPPAPVPPAVKIPELGCSPGQSNRRLSIIRRETVSLRVILLGAERLRACWRAKLASEPNE